VGHLLFLFLNFYQEKKVSEYGMMFKIILRVSPKIWGKYDKLSPEEERKDGSIFIILKSFRGALQDDVKICL